MFQILHDFAKNLLAGLRVAVLRRPSLAEFSVSVEQLVLLSLVYLFTCFAADFVVAGRNGYFDLAALPNALFLVLTLLLVGHLLARLEKDPEFTLALPVVLLSAVPLPALAVISLSLLENKWAWYLYIVWAVAITLAGLVVLTGRRPARLGFGVAPVLILALASQLLLPRDALWVASEDEDLQKPSITREEIFHAQSALFEQRLENLKPQRPGVIDLYFVGFGGDAGLDVFMREVRAAQAVIERRFDAEGRTLALINNNAAAEHTPIASATHLAIALRRIGQIIDPDDDIVFLFLTSHGSKSHRLSVVFDPLELDELDAGRIKRALDEAGIKWRVIVISACYSGGFITPLRDEHALIITAADATHSSFGCESGADFTYFGRAYFGEQLEKTLSFTEAFDAAARTVAGWERKQGYQPSAPQMHLGAAIARQLARLEARLEGHPAGGSPPGGQALANSSFIASRRSKTSQP